jgi:hypothetical protein
VPGTVLTRHFENRRIVVTVLDTLMGTGIIGYPKDQFPF